MNPLHWLCLGFALADAECRRRLLADLEPVMWGHWQERKLLAALAAGPAAVRTLVESWGVRYESDAQPTWQAVLEHARREGLRWKQRTFLGELEAASALLSPEQWEALLAEKVAELTGPAPIAGRVDDAGASCTREQDSFRRKAL